MEKEGEVGMTKETVAFVLIVENFVFSIWLVCGIISLLQKIDRIEAIINILKHGQKGQ